MPVTCDLLCGLLAEQVCQTMKPSTFKKPKMARVARPERRRTRLYSTAMYRLQKEVNAVSRPISIPARTSALALYNMGLEAARLAKLNKRRAITWEEVCSAAGLLCPRRRT
ncbi:hypothetical protein Z043-106298 [Arapaima gigas]